MKGIYIYIRILLKKFLDAGRAAPFRGEKLTSPELPTRLATGAIVRQKEWPISDIPGIPNSWMIYFRME